MAGIGDYVHYTWKGYQEHGISKESKSSSATEAFNRQRESIKNRYASKSKDVKFTNLEKFLNGLYYGKDVDGEQVDTQVIEELRQRVETVFQQKYANFGINWEQSGQVYYKPPVKANQSLASINTLNRYLSTLTSMVDGSIGLKKDADLGHINKVIQLLETEIAKMKKSNTTVLEGSDYKNIKNDIDLALKMQSIPTANAIGDVFEYWLALASQKGKQLAEKEANKIVDEFVKGTNRSFNKIHVSNFSSDYVDFSNIFSGDSGWIPITDSTDFQTKNTTQDKLDVIFKWDDKALRVSAKNYKLADSSQLIHLVSGTSLLYLIADEKSDFVNHWLNCLAATGQGSGGSSLQEAHAAMKITLFAKALIGTENRGTINTFIINNRSARQIRVCDVNELISKADTMLDKIKFSGYPSRLEQQWVGDKSIKNEELAMQRITALLAKVHQQSISVSMSKDIVGFT